jgi:hypothetical protein
MVLVLIGFFNIFCVFIGFDLKRASNKAFEFSKQLLLAQSLGRELSGCILRLLSMYPSVNSELGFSEIYEDDSYNCVNFQTALSLLKTSNNHLSNAVSFVHNEFPVMCHVLGLKEIAHFYKACSFDIANYCYLLRKQQFESETKGRIQLYKKQMLLKNIKQMELDLTKTTLKKKKVAITKKIQNLKNQVRKLSTIKNRCCSPMKVHRQKIIASTPPVTQIPAFEKPLNVDQNDVIEAIDTSLKELPVAMVEEQLKYYENEVVCVREPDNFSLHDEIETYTTTIM